MCYNGGSAIMHAHGISQRQHQRGEEESASFSHMEAPLPVTMPSKYKAKWKLRVGGKKPASGKTPSQCANDKACSSGNSGVS